MNQYQTIKTAVTKKLAVEKSFDIIERPLSIGGRDAVLFFIDGFIKDDTMQRIMQAFFSIKPEQMAALPTAQSFMESQLSYVEVSTATDPDELVTQILSGPSLLLIDGYQEGILIDIRTYPARGVEEPEKEKVVRGSRDGFVETVVFNTALLRRRIRDPKLIFEMKQVGRRSKSDIAIGYIDDLVDHDLLNEIIRRIEKTRVRALTTTQESLAECVIQGNWLNPFPKVRYTERPDVASASLLEGKIIIMVDNDPSVMILPTRLLDFVQEAGDYYYPPIVGGYIRLIRNLMFASTLILTPLWLLAMQNPDYVPQWLKFAVSGESNSVPLILQLLLLEFVIDGLKIASGNTPNILSSSFSIIGGLLLGEFAVKAGWLVPESILYMAFISIATFSQTSLEMGYAIKFCRILLLVCTCLFNLWGFIGALILILILMATNKTFSKEGYLYPLIPFNWKELRRIVLRTRIDIKKESGSRTS